MLEAHYGVPMTGAVLHSLNTRLDAAVIAFQLDHADTKVADHRPRVRARHARTALARAKVKPLVIDYDDQEFPQDGRGAVRRRLRGVPGRGRSRLRLAHAGGRVGGDRAQLHLGHHRQSQGRGLSPPRRDADVLRQRAGGRHGQASRSTCGRCRCSTATAGASRGRCRPSAGTHVCLRWVRAKAMYEAIAEHKVTHLCGAPIVMSTLLNAARGEAAAAAQGRVRHRRGAAARGRAGRAWREAGFNVTHVYGLTEVYGPPSSTSGMRRGTRSIAAEQAALKARQGVRYPGARGPDRDGPEDHARRAGRRRDAGRGHVPRQHRHEGLSQEPAGDGGGVRRRLVPLRRSRRAAPRRLHPAQGPLQGHHHLGRREHLLHRGGGRALQAPGGGGLRRGRQARREVGRDAVSPSSS